MSNPSDKYRPGKYFIRRIRVVDEIIEIFDAKGNRPQYIENSGDKIAARTTDSKTEVIEEFRELTTLEYDLFFMSRFDE